MANCCETCAVRSMGVQCSNYLSISCKKMKQLCEEIKTKVSDESLIYESNCDYTFVDYVGIKEEASDNE